jgi:hypothetical protein
MKRTNIYLTEEQNRLIARRAQALEVSKAEVVRRVLDAGLGITDGTDVEAALEANFGLWADRSEKEIDDILLWRRADRFDRLGL